MRNYDVDGIHLDQVRYYEGDPLRWGYNPTSVARFNAQLRPRPGDAASADRSAVDRLAARPGHRAGASNLYSQTKAIKPNVAVTAAVVTWGRGPQTADDWERQAPYAAVLQDWRAWLQEGIVDYLLPMDYYREDGRAGHVVRYLDPVAGQPPGQPRRRAWAGLVSELRRWRRWRRSARARALGPLGDRPVLVRGADARS